jgi:hypothetical protein
MTSLLFDSRRLHHVSCSGTVGYWYSGKAGTFYYSNDPLRLKKSDPLGQTAKRVFSFLRDRLDRFLEEADVDGVVALMHRPGDVPDEAHADLLGDAHPRGHRTATDS